MHVAYDYSERIASDPQLLGGNTLDIGIFDARGMGASSPGFRGWSGSHKPDFTIAENWATPPYLAGPIQTGTWHVLLGPYKVGPHGCNYEVAITFSEDPGQPERHPMQVSATRGSPTRAERGWLRGDLHCHTLFSDGDSWPADMLADLGSQDGAVAVRRLLPKLSRSLVLARRRDRYFSAAAREFAGVLSTTATAQDIHAQ